MATLWETITGNSSLPVQAGNTLWGHLNNQQGGGGVYLMGGLDVDVAVAGHDVDVTLQACDVEVEVVAHDIDMQLPDMPLNVEVDEMDVDHE